MLSARSRSWPRRRCAPRHPPVRATCTTAAAMAARITKRTKHAASMFNGFAPSAPIHGLGGGQHGAILAFLRAELHQ